MFLSPREIFDIIVMTVVVGFIFKDVFARLPGMDKNAFKFACMVTAPALIAHELAHKFFAIGFGLDATFHAAYFWLAIAIGLKLLRTGFVFFVPAFVSISNGSAVSGTSLAVVAGAGPLLNLVLFAGAWLLLRQKKLKRRTFIFLQITKQINLFLFVLNMLPIPMFDGFKVYSGLFQAFF